VKLDRAHVVVFGDDTSNGDNSTVHILTKNSDGGRWTLLATAKAPEAVKNDIVSFQLDNLIERRWRHLSCSLVNISQSLPTLLACFIDGLQLSLAKTLTLTWKLP
jgi:hypothetical protein